MERWRNKYVCNTALNCNFTAQLVLIISLLCIQLSALGLLMNELLRSPGRCRPGCWFSCSCNFQLSK